MVEGSKLFPSAKVRRVGELAGFVVERVAHVSVDGLTAQVVSESGGVRVFEWVSCSKLELVVEDEDLGVIG